MDYDVFKIDLDMKTKNQAIKFLMERLAYMHDIDFFNIHNIKKIELIKKTKHGCVITLYEPLNKGNEDSKALFIICMQLILGSDYMKEVNTLLNHFKFKMKYSNRLFTTKRYKGDKIVHADKIDVTVQIKQHVLNPTRVKSWT